MENIVVTTFQDAKASSDALNKLKELDQLGDINLYNTVLMQRTSNDGYKILHKEGPDTFDIPLEGAMLGTMVGLLAGPVGMAIGLMTGMTAGVIGADEKQNFSSDFIEKVKNRLAVGEFALVVDVEEYSDFMIDTYMAPFNGKTFHTDIDEQYDRYHQQEIDDFNKQIDEAEAAWHNARQEDKAAAKAKLDQLKAQRKERVNKIKASASHTKQQIQDMIKSIDQKISTSNDKAKEKLEEQKAKMKAKLNKFNDELAWAFSLD